MSALSESREAALEDQLERIEAMLARVIAERDVTELWQTKSQTAEILGVSVRWLELRINEGMPHREIAGKRVLRIPEVEGWLRKRGLLREVRR